jgi:hypothetical protein
MISNFKFLKKPLLLDYRGDPIYVGEFFHSVNKEDMESLTRPGKIIPKYTIVTRCIQPIHKDKFKPDHKVLWYFKSKAFAEFFVGVCEASESGLIPL